MLFEFLKNLFWKADDNSKKRKAPTSVHYKCDVELKKQCRGILKNNYNQTELSYNAQHLSSCMCSNCANVCIGIRKDSSSFDCSAEKSFKFSNRTFHDTTMYNTNRLLEKQQYSQMLNEYIYAREIGANKSCELKPEDSEMLKNSQINCESDKSSTTREYIKPTKLKGISPSKARYDLSALSNLTYKVHQVDIETNVSSDKKKTMTNLPNHNGVEIIKMNTFQDYLHNKDVARQDYLHQLAKHYNEKLNQHLEEVAELKKKTLMLSKYNKLSREISLEERLNRSIQLCETILDEDYFKEEPKYPELSDEMLKKVNSALADGFGDEVLVQSFGLQIRKRDIQTLSGLNWLNDEVINFYMNLLIERGKNTDFPSVYAMNTFFYPKLVAGGHASLKRWTRKVDLFSKDLIIIPIHLGIHWCMSIIDLKNKKISYYDSMGSSNQKCLNLLKQYLHDESLDKKKKTFDFTGWDLKCLKDIPQQMNGSDCGVFSCTFAEYVSANKEFNFSQDDMPYFRKKMIYEILTTKLL
ncbi:sentrin-specific protease 1-like [Trichogramma pretiosum]|uniref:sentrin-specific protease 1-like n=1 Tax=Trichogramma pretiosum TaxID=7493 RepID=UPI0006C9DA5A|nr:sentrin-specific protease 1-like [Trichogramma pretiosum]